MQAYQQDVSRHHRHPWIQCRQGPQRRASGAGGTGCQTDAAQQLAQSAWRLQNVATLLVEMLWQCSGSLMINRGYAEHNLYMRDC